MKLAFSTNAFRKYSIEQSIDMIAKAGYDAIELMCDSPHAFPPISTKQLTSIQNSLEKNKIGISNLNGFMMCEIEDFHHPSWIESDPLRRQKRINHTINCIELAKKLGAKTVSTEPGGPLEHMTTEKGLEIFKEGLEQVIPIAEKNQINLLVEPEPNLLIENSEQFLKFISNFNTKYLGLNFDVGHFFCVNEDPAILIKSLKDYISHVHLEDIASNRVHQHLIPGKGAINFVEIFKALDSINYNGFVTVELYPYENDPEQAARSAIEYLRNMIC
ncbi:MAG: sugar phosphate isomerase/epimerase [Thaumarchaeota archaeon]|nr:sugar phosphate isomerase/epimerase [Nitrososphaerota archaeon]